MSFTIQSLSVPDVDAKSSATISPATALAREDVAVRAERVCLGVFQARGVLGDAIRRALEEHGQWLLRVDGREDHRLELHAVTHGDHRLRHRESGGPGRR